MLSCAAGHSAFCCWSKHHPGWHARVDARQGRTGRRGSGAITRYHCGDQTIFPNTNNGGVCRHRLPVDICQAEIHGCCQSRTGCRRYCVAIRYHSGHPNARQCMHHGGETVLPTHKLGFASETLGAGPTARVFHPHLWHSIPDRYHSALGLRRQRLDRQRRVR